MDLIADIGGTHTRCALATGGRITRLRVLANRDFATLGEALLHYLAEVERPRLEAAALSVAAPVLADHVRMVNVDWHFSRAALARMLGVRRLLVLNDFSALAWSLLRLRRSDLAAVRGGGAQQPQTALSRHAPRIVIGPGTGLGCGVLAPCPQDGWTAIPGEGGHATLPAANEREAAVIALARVRLGHVSAERLVSGPGLALLYELIGELEGDAGRAVSPEHVSALADAGDARAAAAQEMFFCMLATVASNYALYVGALGGVYIAGGIVPARLEAFQASGFRQRFEDKGRYREYLQRVPAWVVTREHPALAGLQELLSRTKV